MSATPVVAYVIMCGDLYLDKYGEWDVVERAELFPPFMALEALKTYPDTVAIRANVGPRRQGRFLLLELLLSMLILCILFSISAPTVARIIQAQQAQAARQRIETVARAEQAIAICNTLSDCTPSANAAAIIPADGSTLVTGGYRFTFTAGWLYTATPVNSTGQPTFVIGPDGVTMCGGAPCH